MNHRAHEEHEGRKRQRDFLVRKEERIKIKIKFFLFSFFVSFVCFVVSLSVLGGCCLKTPVQTQIDAPVKPTVQSPEQSAGLAAESGGDTYQTNVSMAGGGAVAVVTLIVIGVLGWRLNLSGKALRACTDGIEQWGNPNVKAVVRDHAEADGIEDWLHKRVKKWYGGKKADNSKNG